MSLIPPPKLPIESSMIAIRPPHLIWSEGFCGCLPPSMIQGMSGPLLLVRWEAIFSLTFYIHIMEPWTTESNLRQRPLLICPCHYLLAHLLFTVHCTFTSLSLTLGLKQDWFLTYRVQGWMYNTVLRGIITCSDILQR